MPRLTATIATYNGRELLEVVLASLERQTFRDFRVVVVDDASSDGTVEWLRERWPDVDVVVHPHNRGVTAALNSCVRANDDELVLMLNNDVELDPRCVEQLVTALDERPAAAVACAKLLDFAQRDLLDGAGDLYAWAGIAHRRGQGERDRGQYDQPEDVFGACAAVALYRRDAFEAVGPFDERFHALCEDIDWAFRAQLAGYDCRYVPSAVAYHVGSASLGPRISDFTMYHNWRNELWLIAKNYPATAFLWHLPDLLFGQLAMISMALRRRLVRTWLRAWRDAVRGLPGVLEDRRRIQRKRVRNRRDLEAVVIGGMLRPEWWRFVRGKATSVTPRARRTRAADQPASVPPPSAPPRVR